MSKEIREAAERNPAVSKNPFYVAVCEIDRGDQGKIPWVESEKGRRVAEWVEAVAGWLLENGRTPNNIPDAGWWARELDELVQLGLVERVRNLAAPASLQAPRTPSVLERGGTHGGGPRARVAGTAPTVTPTPLPAAPSVAVRAPATATPAVVVRPVSPPSSPRPGLLPDDSLVPEAVRGSLPELSGIGPHPVRTLGAWSRMDEADRWLAVYTLVGAMSQEVGGPFLLSVVRAYLSAEFKRQPDAVTQVLLDVLMLNPVEQVREVLRAFSPEPSSEAAPPAPQEP